jgi:putative hemolysin
MNVGIELFILFLLLAANGVFAMAEIAVVSSRRGKLRRAAELGNTKAQSALMLAESPNRFLATVQVGITLVGIVAGAFGGATLSEKLSGPISRLDFAAPYAEQISFGIVVLGITYFSLVLGELVPKRLGLSDPEGIAMKVAGPMTWLSKVASPLISLLTASTEGLLKVAGFKPVKEAIVSEEEVRVLMQEGLRAGAFNKIESDIVHSALELDKLTVRELMTPRPKIIWVNKDESQQDVWHKIVVSGHSYYPVYQGIRDHVVGIVSVKSIFANLAAGTVAKISDLMVPPMVIPASQSAVQLVEIFKTSGKHIALVVDEFGAIVGLVSLTDILESLVGEFPSQEQRSRPSASKREDGTWLVDAIIDLEDFQKAVSDFGKIDDPSQFQTLAGLLLKKFGHIPKEGEKQSFERYEAEIIDMDGHRIDKVLLIPKEPWTPPAQGLG